MAPYRIVRQFYPGIDDDLRLDVLDGSNKVSKTVGPARNVFSLADSCARVGLAIGGLEQVTTVPEPMHPLRRNGKDVWDLPVKLEERQAFYNRYVKERAVVQSEHRAQSARG